MALHDLDQLTGFDSVSCWSGVWHVCCMVGFSKQCGKLGIQSKSGIFGHLCLDVLQESCGCVLSGLDSDLKSTCENCKLST